VSYTFDGPNRLVLCNAGTVVIVLADLWSRWKDWVLQDNAHFLPAFDTVGGEIPAIPLYLFTLNGWRIRPQSANHTLIVRGGVLVDADAGDPFVDPVGNYVVRIQLEAPGIAIGYSSGGGGGTGPTSSQIAAAVLAAMNSTPPGVDVRRMNGAQVIGDGSELDHWRGIGVSP
jgi:hypothetical protein